MLVVNKGERKCVIFDIAVPGHSRVSNKKKKRKQRSQEYQKGDSCTFDCGCTRKHHKEIG